jgi:hypothetical protein
MASALLSHGANPISPLKVDTTAVLPMISISLPLDQHPFLAPPGPARCDRLREYGADPRSCSIPTTSKAKPFKAEPK